MSQVSQKGSCRGCRAAVGTMVPAEERPLGSWEMVGWWHAAGGEGGTGMWFYWVDGGVWNRRLIVARQANSGWDNEHTPHSGRSQTDRENESRGDNETESGWKGEEGKRRRGEEVTRGVSDGGSDPGGDINHCCLT